MDNETRDVLIERAWGCYLAANVIVKTNPGRRASVRETMIDSRLEDILDDGLSVTRDEVARLLDAMFTTAETGVRFSSNEIVDIADQALEPRAGAGEA